MAREKARGRIVVTLARLAVVSLLGLSSACNIGTFSSFDASEFRAAQQRGETIVLHFYSASCGACRVQSQALETALAAPEFERVRRYRIGLDAGEKVTRKPVITTLVTVVVFRGAEEIGRVVAKTDPDFLRTFIRRAL